MPDVRQPWRRPMDMAVTTCGPRSIASKHLPSGGALPSYYRPRSPTSVGKAPTAALPPLCRRSSHHSRPIIPLLMPPSLR